MKRGLLLLLFVFLAYSASSQVVVYQEDFEPPTLDNLVTSTQTVPGIPDWGINSNLSVSGIHSDTCKVKNLGTTYLTTTAFNTVGNTYVILEFNHICKINFLDIAEVEASGDNGVTWVKLTGSNYLGTSTFASNGARFGPNVYGLDWYPQNNLEIPTSAWFKSEVFDVSAICADKTQAKIRFKLSDGGGLANNPEYGWVIDDIKVTAALSELTPPTINSFLPVYNGNIFNTGPYNFTANITDVSGIYRAYIPFTRNGIPDTLNMVAGANNNFSVTMPKVSHLDNICYKLVAIDNSLSRNTAYSPQLGQHCFTASSQEASIIAVTSPNTACGLGLEPVTIQIKNNSADTIEGNLWASYYIVGKQDTVTEYINTPILPNQVLNYTFDSLADVSTVSGDILYTIQTFIKLLGDPTPGNDGMQKSFYSGFVPPPPAINDTISIAYGTSVVLNAISPVTVKWYTDSAATNLFHTGPSYTTPILFSSVNYYVRAQSGQLQCLSPVKRVHIAVGSAPPWDGALTAMITPVSSIFKTANETVKVKLMSFGVDTVGNFPVYYTINGGAPVMQMFTGYLAPGDSTFFTFTQKADLSVPGSYLFKTYISVPGDITKQNDTITTNIVHIVPNYCQSYAVNGGVGSDIGNVTFSNLNNGVSTPTTNNPNANGSYEDYTNLPPVQLAINLTYPLTVRKINKGSSNNQSVIKVWIDYNRNGIFENPGEMVMNATTGFANYFVTTNVTVPSTVVPGLTRMRVVMTETTNASTVTPCNPYAQGETEDYHVNMYEQIPFDGGVTTVTAPGALVPEASSQAVTVIIKNYGLDTLTSMQVGYVHNNNPAVTIPWTGTLAPNATTLVTLPNLTVAGGNNTVCGFTVVNGDINFGNDQTCKPFYGDPLQNAQAISMPNPSATGCFVAHEPVTIKIKNVGLNAISGGLTASYRIKGQTAVVTETVSATINPNQTYDYTFNQLADLTAYIKDTIWTIYSWTNLVGDFEKHNDTTFRTVEALYSPPVPVVSNVTIPYATTATLTALSPDTIFWYKTQTAQDEIGSGPTYTTPILYGQEVYWVEAQADGGAESVQVGTGTTTQNLIPFYYNYDYGWSAMIFTASELNIDGNIDTVSFYVTTTMSNYTHNGQKLYLGHTTASSFTDANMPSTTNMVKVYDGNLPVPGPGWMHVLLQTPFDYNGTDNLLVYWENHEGSYIGNPTITFRHTPTTVNRAKYKYQDGSFPTSAGTLTLNRPNARFGGSGGGCPSPRVPDTVFVTGVPPYDGAVLKLAAPNTAVNLPGNAPVSILIKNYGTQAISNFSVSYQINGGVINTDVISATLQQGDTLLHTFSTTADLQLYGNYNFKTWISVNGDATPVNDTILKLVRNLIPPYCLSYATIPLTYDDIGNVTISNLNNGNPLPSTNNQNANAGYTDYTNLPPVLLSPGVPYPISISRISATTLASNVAVKVYIDYNRSGTFDILPSSEIAFTATFSSTTMATVTGTVIVPLTAMTGQTVMRVVLDRSGAAPPCGTYSYGETEDYLVHIMPLIPFDAGVTQIIQPSGLADFGTSTPVQVKVQNFGTTALNNLNIAYTVNGGSPILYNYLQPLAPQATANVMLPFHIYVEGNNRICAYTIVPGDSNVFNDMRCVDVYARFTTDVPYFTNFEGQESHFWPDSVPNQWQRGIPSGNVIAGAYSSPNAWVTRLDGPYAHNGTNFLYTPMFNHLVKGLDSLRFYHQVHTNSGKDGGAIQYKSIMGWKLLGSQGDPKAVNWYNSPMGIWTGQGGGPGWRYSAYGLKGINDMAEPTQLRFLFFTTENNTANWEGWAIDNFELTIPIIPFDAGVVEILAPTNPVTIGTPMSVQVRVANFGHDTLTQIPLRYKVNGATVASGLWTGVVAPGDTVLYTFSPMATPLKDFTLCVFTQVTGDINLYNNTTCDTFYVIPATYDLAVTEIVTPRDTTIHNLTANVSAWVKNMGLTAVTSFDIEYSVAGQVKASETWSDANGLAPGDSVLYSFTTPYQHDFIGYYYLCVKAIYPQDGYAFNDELCYILEEVYTEITETDLEGYQLGQNIPNPARTTTLIPFSLPSYGEVVFTVMNYMGQTVYTERMNKGAGQHQLRVDASQWPAGVYFYSVEYKDRKLARKMIIE